MSSGNADVDYQLWRLSLQAKQISFREYIEKQLATAQKKRKSLERQYEIIYHREVGNRDCMDPGLVGIGSHEAAYRYTQARQQIAFAEQQCGVAREEERTAKRVKKFMNWD